MTTQLGTYLILLLCNNNATPRCLKAVVQQDVKDVKDNDVVDLLDDDSDWDEPAKPAAKKGPGSKAKPPSQRAAPAAAVQEKPVPKPAKKAPASPRARPPSAAKCASPAAALAGCPACTDGA